MSKMLVTGGAGFIGSNLCEELFKLGHEVWSIDNYSTGSKKNHIKGVEYIKASTHDIDKLPFTPNYIFHLGEYSRVEQSFEDIKTVWDYNMNGTFAVLEFTRKTGAKLIYAGSSTKFGDIGPNSSPYAFTKSTNTQLVQNYADWYGIEYAITYFYNVYGKREIATGKYATVIAKFLDMHKKGQTLTVTSPGTQQRNFTHVDDIVSGLILVGEKGYGDDYAIGNPRAYSVLEIAQMIGGEIEMLPEKKGNRMGAMIASGKTRSLGWEPKKNIEDYINEMRGKK